MDQSYTNWSITNLDPLTGPSNTLYAKFSSLLPIQGDFLGFQERNNIVFNIPTNIVSKFCKFKHMNLEVEGVEPQRFWEMDLTHGHVNGRTVLDRLTFHFLASHFVSFSTDSQVLTHRSGMLFGIRNIESKRQNGIRAILDAPDLEI
ncbi:hypothetical protein P8452_07596 [Trifolium repens]|nr:hypothetical protein P8452_07596 [Trifolium repens]